MQMVGRPRFLLRQFQSGDTVGRLFAQSEEGQIMPHVYIDHLSGNAASLAPICTMTNLNAVQSVVIRRQLARARTPSMTSDCDP